MQLTTSQFRELNHLCIATMYITFSVTRISLSLTIIEYNCIFGNWTINELFYLPVSVTRFGEFSPLWQNLKKFFNLLWRILFTVPQVFIDVNGQILKNKLAIWPHCFQFSLIYSVNRSGYDLFWLNAFYASETKQPILLLHNMSKQALSSLFQLSCSVPTYVTCW